MAIQITRPGKNAIILEVPVMAAAGILGFGDTYRDLIQFEKLGAFVTNPVTYQPWKPAIGNRVIELPAGTLVHTGIPNPGISKVLAKYRNMWESMAMPVIMHIAATSLEHARKCASRIDAESAIDGIELGLNDDVTWFDVEQMVNATVRNTEKPVLVRLPMNDTLNLGRAAADAGASGLVACAAPRGTARDPRNGQLMTGRIYGPLIKPVVLKLVQQLAEQISDVPIVGAGGIHSQQDARDYLEAGAKAVQVDTVTWIQPKLLEYIARDLGGLVLTRAAGALADEWHPGFGETERKAREEAQRKLDEDSKKTPTGH
jgi:dihydroorotate dehydrogenase (NAD+) catalytic subunit